MAELSEEIYGQIKTHCEEGNDYCDTGEYDDAIKEFQAAFDLIPEPKKEWEAYTWVLTALGDAHFHKGDFEQGRACLSDAMHGPDAIGNPFIHLRLGQCQFELGNKERAADELARAYMGAGGDIFEEDDPKYYDFIKSILKPPPGGWD